MHTDTFTTSVVEALILASPEPLPARKIADQIEDLSPGQVGQAVAELNTRYFNAGASYRIREIAGGYQFYILPEYTGYVEEMFTRRRKMRLTRAALETLAIVAYRQPVTKTEIEHIRGVASDGVLHNLLEKDMITIKGRAAGVGKPLQYGTTDEFLKFFGLARLEDLPKMKEIEELVKAGEAEAGDQLSFGADVLDTQLAQKLNIADGTFDPRSREEDEEGIGIVLRPFAEIAADTMDVDEIEAEEHEQSDEGDEEDDEFDHDDESYEDEEVDDEDVVADEIDDEDEYDDSVEYEDDAEDEDDAVDDEAEDSAEDELIEEDEDPDDKLSDDDVYYDDDEDDLDDDGLADEGDEEEKR